MAGSFAPSSNCPLGFQQYYGDKTGCVPIGLTAEKAESYLNSVAGGASPATAVITTALTPTTSTTGSTSSLSPAPGGLSVGNIKALLPNITGDVLPAVANAVVNANTPAPPPPPGFFDRIPVGTIVLASAGVIASLIVVKTLLARRASG